jgi:hypothetical protein
MQIRRVLLVSVLACVCTIARVAPAAAQNWSFDARSVALGGVGDSGNIAVSMIEEQRPYRSIVIPLGLLQVLKDFGKFNPDDDDFDPVLAAEYAVSPVHYTFGRDTNDTQSQFIVDVLNGELSRDLNDYTGFVPSGELRAAGLASPSWGKTIKFRENGNAFHGIFIGAGPYLSMQTEATVDEQMRTILDSDVPIYIPNTSFPTFNTTTSQIALAITGGYRGRFALPSGMGSGEDIEGIYVAANYHYLHGFRYEDFDTDFRLDTDGNGLLTLNTALPPPLVIGRNSAESGRGFAIDIGGGVVVERWQFGFGANGLGNRIEWSDVERTIYSMTDVVTGDGEFDDSDPVLVDDVEVELPVDYRGYVAYTTDAWAATTEVGRGLQGTTFRAGLEKRFDRIELRGGARFIRDRWEPSGGVGFNFTDRVGLDVAAFGTSANVERQRRLALALSIRIEAGQQ